MKIWFKKSIALILVLGFFVSPVVTSAQWVVWDPGNFVPNTATAINTTVSAANDTANSVKEFGLDAVAWIIVNLIIERMAASTVNWINSGFKGSPAFVTNPAAYFQDIGDKVAGQFLFSNPNLNFLCGPISAKIKIALAQAYTGQNRKWQCSLTDAIGNMDDFMNDFENGGWDKFFRLTQERQNNPIGAYIQAEVDLNNRLAQKQNQKNNELSWGKGFLSFSKCPEGHTVTDVHSSGNTDTVTYSDGVTIQQDYDPELTIGSCGVDEEIQTPGSVIETSLNNVLNIGNQKLAVADEINEIVSALLNQLVSRVVGGIGSGLRSLSSPSPTDNNRAFIENLANSTSASTTDYFGNKVDTSILNVPPPTFDYNLDSGKPVNPVYPNQPTQGQGNQNCDPNTDPFCTP